MHASLRCATLHYVRLSSVAPHDVTSVARAGDLRPERIPPSLGGSLKGWREKGFGVDVWVSEEAAKWGTKDDEEGLGRAAETSGAAAAAAAAAAKGAATKATGISDS